MHKRLAARRSHGEWFRFEPGEDPAEVVRAVILDLEVAWLARDLQHEAVEMAAGRESFWPDPDRSGWVPAV